MPPQPLDNLAEAHRFFSADCFNRTWSLIDKPDRSAADDQQMLLLAVASLWHWTQRPDCADLQLSVGLWQVSRVYSLLGQAENARCYAEKCLSHSQALEPFFLAYAHEALARAALVAKDGPAASKHRAIAQELAQQVANPDDRSQLLLDLSTIA